jgi:hypothetical protein
MRGTRKVYVALAVVFVPVFVWALISQMKCEHLHRCDSLGLWYTVYCATWDAAEVSLVPAVLIGLTTLVVHLRSRMSARK